MIFLLDTDEDELAAMEPDDAESLFTLLIDADRCGRHFIVIKRAICGWALTNLKLSGQNQNHLNYLKEQYATRGAIHKSATSYIKLVFGDDPIIANDQYFQIGHKVFIAGEFASSKTIMTVENINADSKLYEFIFQVACKYTNVPNWSVEYILGGGDTTATAFEGEIEKNRVAICVVDTDRISPCDKLGQTAKKVLKVDRKRNIVAVTPPKAYVGKAFETIGHELENYIPLIAIKQINCFTCPEGLDDYISQETLKDSEDCLWQYFDIKNGVDGGNIVKKLNAGNKSQDVVDWIREKFGLSFDDFGKFKIQGIGRSVTQHFLACVAAKEQYFAFSKTEYWKALFLKHFEEILWFLASSEANRV